MSVQQGIDAGSAIGLLVNKPPAGVPEKPLTVVLLGWYGSQHRYLAKYTSLLNAAGYPTIAGICPPRAVFSPTIHGGRRFARGLLDFLQAAAAASDERPRYAFYVFSNGGAFPLEQVAWLAHNEKRYSDFQDSVQGLLFDSSPCFMSTSVGAQAMRENQPLLVRILVTIAFFLGVFVMVFLSPNRPQKYWHNMTHLSLGRKDLYLYSEDDHLCDFIKLEELIEERRALGREVVAHKWIQSQHVGHLRCHPEEYSQLLLSFLDSLAVVKAS